MLRYFGYVVSMVALYWLPILLFWGHPLSDQLIESVLMLIVVVLIPMNKGIMSHLRWWISLPLGSGLLLLVLLGHTYIAFEVMGHERAGYDVKWSILAVMYAFCISVMLTELIMNRSLKK